MRQRVPSPIHATTRAGLCPRMPVLDHLHAERNGVHVDVRAFFGLQHLFGSTASLVRKITSGRVEPGAVYLLGKPYSANRRVVRFLRDDLGYWVHPRTCEQAVGKANDGEIDRRVEGVLEALKGRLREWDDPRAKVLLIDDGGRAIRMLHEDRYADIRSRFTCVEQTRCGVRTLEDTELEVPVVNVAESWVKLEHESPMIAESVNHELSRQLRAMEAAGIGSGRRALVIGYGAIGQAVSAELRRSGRDVAVHDKRPEGMADAARDGYRIITSLSAALRRGGVVVGCSGKPVLGENDYGHIPDDTILVSASSADVEFRAWQLRTRATCLGRTLGGTSGGPGALGHPCFSLYRVHLGARRFYLVNGGFPVNFNGGVDPIEPGKIQLTRSLLYLGAVQASHATAPGLHPLNDDAQRRLLELFELYRRAA